MKPESKLIVCPDCSNYLSKTAKFCPKCGHVQPRSLAVEAVTGLFWVVTIMGALVGAFILISATFSKDMSAIQQGSAFSLAICCAVIPYCFARALAEIEK